jgi:phage-related tail protein
MIIMSRDKKLRKLGKNLETATKRLALLDQFMSSQKLSSRKLGALLEDLEESMDAFKEADTQIAELTATLAALTTSVKVAESQFEFYSRELKTLDTQLNELVRAEQAKNPPQPPLVVPAPVPLTVPPVPKAEG